MSSSRPSEVTTVIVSNVSLSATPQDIQEFFSFSGIVEYILLKSGNHRSQISLVTFKDSKGAETAVLLSGATIVDQPVDIALEPDYVLPSEALGSSSSLDDQEDKNVGVGAASPSAVLKAEDVVSSMLAKGYILGKDAVDKAKAFDEKHQVISTAAAKVAELDQKIGFSGKVSIGATIVNDKMKDMDQKYQVTEKTKSALAGAGSAVMKNRYVFTGVTWAAGAFSQVTRAAGEVSQKAMDKVSEEQQLRGGTTTSSDMNKDNSNNNNAPEAAADNDGRRP